MAVLVLKMSIFPIFNYEQGECNATFRAHQVLKNGFHLITTSFYDQKSVLSPKEEISRNNFYNPLEQCALATQSFRLFLMVQFSSALKRTMNDFKNSFFPNFVFIPRAKYIFSRDMFCLYHF